MAYHQHQREHRIRRPDDKTGQYRSRFALCDTGAASFNQGPKRQQGQPHDPAQGVKNARVHAGRRIPDPGDGVIHVRVHIDIGRLEHHHGAAYREAYEPEKLFQAFHVRSLLSQYKPLPVYVAKKPVLSVRIISWYAGEYDTTACFDYSSCGQDRTMKTSLFSSR